MTHDDGHAHIWSTFQRQSKSVPVLSFFKFEPAMVTKLLNCHRQQYFSGLGLQLTVEILLNGNPNENVSVNKRLSLDYTKNIGCDQFGLDHQAA